MNKLNTVFRFLFPVFTNRHSISFKVSFVFFIACIILVSKLVISYDYSMKKQLSESISPFLGSYSEHLEKALAPSFDLEKAQEIVRDSHINLVINTKEVNWSSCPSIPKIKELDAVIDKKFADKDVVAGFYQGRLFIMATYPNQDQIVMLTKEPLISSFSRQFVLFIILIVFIYIVFLGCFMIYYFIRPIKKMQEGLKRIGDGEVSYRLPIARKDEIGQLSRSINQMACSIEKMLDSKRQMILGISHELRSPLTRVKLILSLSENTPMKESLIEEFDKMEMIIGELLESEKIKEGHQPLVFDLISVNDLVHQVKENFFEHALIRLELDDNLSKHYLDGSKMALAIKSIINNALLARKNKQDEIVVSSYYEQNNVVIAIKDFGIGISADEMENIFKPFYRACKKKEMAYAGLGVGLHLTKAIIETHRGELYISSQEDKGTTVKIVLPTDLA